MTGSAVTQFSSRPPWSLSSASRLAWDTCSLPRTPLGFEVGQDQLPRGQLGTFWPARPSGTPRPLGPGAAAPPPGRQRRREVRWRARDADEWKRDAAGRERDNEDEAMRKVRENDGDKWEMTEMKGNKGGATFNEAESTLRCDMGMVFD